MTKKRATRKVNSIEGLARLMQGEFLGVNKRMDSEFANVHKRMDSEFANVNKRIDTLETNLAEMQKSSSELFSKLDEFISMYRDSRQELTILARQVK